MKIKLTIGEAWYRFSHGIGVVGQVSFACPMVGCKGTLDWIDDEDCVISCGSPKCQFKSTMRKLFGCVKDWFHLKIN